jgi:hypothetical protein
VSKKKRRFKADGYNLGLSLEHNKILGMAAKTKVEINYDN